MPVNFTSDIGSQKGNELNKKTKLKQSHFSLTINPNISSIVNTDFHDQIYNKMMKATKEIFENIDNFAGYILFLEHGASFNDTWIDSVELIPNVEYGNLKKWHLNASIKIDHYTRIRLNRNKLLETYAKHLNTKPNAIHIEIRVPNSNKNYSQNLEKYVKKGRSNNLN